MHNEWLLSAALLNGLAVIAISFSALIGYLFGFSNFQHWPINGAEAINPNTALCLLLCGVTFVLISIHLKHNQFDSG